jgi:hypothetical protein
LKKQNFNSYFLVSEIVFEEDEEGNSLPKRGMEIRDERERG